MATHSERADYRGLRVAAFERRRAEEMARMIERHGGVAFVSPAMREVAIRENRVAIDFAHRLITGEVGVVIFTTGVGFRHLLKAVERHVPRQRYLDSLSDIITVARGPKPVAAMAEVGLKPTHRVPEPNTWREVLATVDRELQVINQTVAVQEYGIPNRSLVAGLEARGARVLNVPVYTYDLPEDRRPLEENIRALAAGHRDVVLFTSAQQVVNLMLLADHLQLEEPLRGQWPQMVVASVGPTTSETLRDHELAVDLEPAHPKMGPLVTETARRAHELLAGKRSLAAPTGVPSPPPASPVPAASPSSPAWASSLFLRACRREPVERTPVWLMRQAGRYMREYREVRATTGFLELCKNPELASEVMLTAVERLGVDAAIIFSDLLPILEPMGLELEFAPHEGPVIHNPLRAARDVERLRELEQLDELEFVLETVRRTRAGLPEHLPLIGFAGAPFTLASYAIEGGASRSYVHTKRLMFQDEGAWSALMERLARSVARYLCGQVAAGAQCVQLFDSWVGCLGPDDYRRYVLPYVQQIVAEIPADVPVINFATGNPSLLPLLAEAGSAVVGVDWRIRLDDAWRTVGYDRAVQGNLDPVVLLADPRLIRQRVGEVLAQAGGRWGHIFNLGHGILPQTPVEHAVALVEAVHELSERR